VEMEARDHLLLCPHTGHARVSALNHLFKPLTKHMNWTGLLTLHLKHLATQIAY